jgi:hypothetical protein
MILPGRKERRREDRKWFAQDWEERARQDREWDEADSVVAAGAVCPVPQCGSMVITYHPADSINAVTRRYTTVWEFVCPACGFEFEASSDDLIFQSVPRHWLLAEVCHA